MRPIRALFLCTALVTVSLGACTPTPASLEKWANRDGSEEMFSGFLKDPEVSQEVRNKALELLIDQWQYSSALFIGGRVLREIPDAAVRDATILANVPHLQAMYDNADTRATARDATYQIRNGTDSAEVQAALDGVLLQFVNRDWSPCLESGGSVSASQIFTVLGPARTEARVVGVISEGAFDDVLCVIRTLGSTAWLAENAPVASAIIARWDAGNISDVPQFNFELLEFLMRFRTVPAVRTWFFARLNDPNFDATFKNAIFDWVSQNPADGDLDQYRALLTNERYTRWAAADVMINRGGSDGLRAVLQNLPPTGEYAYYDEAFPVDGFRSVADRIFCALPKLQELGDNARRVFEESLALPGLPSRALALSCLKLYGDNQTVAAITAWTASLGRDPIALPGFGEGATLQALADETIAAIQARLAAPR